jgi:hypothetical protein
VCDGWQETDLLKQYHMNYGWDDGHTAWYTMDALYCIDGCDQSQESMITNIEPDRSVMMSCDTTFGWVPLDISFTGSSEYTVDAWHWTFGDGDSSTDQSPLHTYNTAGMFDIGLTVDVGEDTMSIDRSQHIIAVADTMKADDVAGAANSDIEVAVYANNTIPVKQIIVPFEFYGTVGCVYDSFSVDGCRTDYFEYVDYIAQDLWGKRYTIKLLSSTGGGSPDLTPGAGPILKLYFSVPYTATSGKVDTVSFDGYSSYLPTLSGTRALYHPVPVDVMINGTCCKDRGNVDGLIGPGGAVDVGDLTYLVAYLFGSGFPPSCIDQGNVDALTGPGGPVDVGDLTFLVAFLFGSGAPPPPC